MKLDKSCESWQKLWNLKNVLKFSESCGIVDIVKLEKNGETWQKF